MSRIFSDITTLFTLSQVLEKEGERTSEKQTKFTGK